MTPLMHSLHLGVAEEPANIHAEISQPGQSTTSSHLTDTPQPAGCTTYPNSKLSLYSIVPRPVKTLCTRKGPASTVTFSVKLLLLLYATVLNVNSQGILLIRISRLWAVRKDKCMDS